MAAPGTTPIRRVCPRCANVRGPAPVPPWWERWSPFTEIALVLTALVMGFFIGINTRPEPRYATRAEVDALGLKVRECVALGGRYNFAAGLCVVERPQ
jgi:hypothetical protein